jgi:hypothetical protein
MVKNVDLLILNITCLFFKIFLFKDILMQYFILKKFTNTLKQYKNIKNNQFKIEK